MPNICPDCERDTLDVVTDICVGECITCGEPAPLSFDPYCSPTCFETDRGEPFIHWTEPDRTLEVVR